MLQPNQLDAYIKTLSPHGVDLITLHWTVGHYDQVFPDAYHFQILGDGSIRADPRAFPDGAFQPLAHAWHHNTANIGISLCAMLGATCPEVAYDWKEPWTFPVEYGQYPPTLAQLTSMLELLAKLVVHFGLTVKQIKTHYDLAAEDGYRGERWEFKYERDFIISRLNLIIGTDNDKK